jgi:hypothetical protein
MARRDRRWPPPPGDLGCEADRATKHAERNATIQCLLNSGLAPHIGALLATRAKGDDIVEAQFGLYNTTKGNWIAPSQYGDGAADPDVPTPSSVRPT